MFWLLIRVTATQHRETQAFPTKYKLSAKFISDHIIVGVVCFCERERERERVCVYVCVLWGKACLFVGEQVRMTMGTEGWIYVVTIGFLSRTKKAQLTLRCLKQHCEGRSGTSLLKRQS